MIQAVTTRLLSLHLLLGGMLLTVCPTTSTATEEFSRKYNMNCTLCHTSSRGVTAPGHTFIDANDRMAGITFDRAAIFDYRLGMANLALAPASGSHINPGLAINTSGHSRSGNYFDQDDSRLMFGRLGTDLGPINGGLFASGGLDRFTTTSPQRQGAEKNGQDNAAPTSIFGVDFNGMIGSHAFWYAQAVWNEWDALINLDNERKWLGGYAGIDYIHNPSWTYSLLYQYTDTRALARTDSRYDGDDMKTLTFTASHNFMLNIKGVIEYNLDLQDTRLNTEHDLNSELTNEDYILFGLDAAF